uniref:Uncharacterized protein n=1 Tax=Arundo donax TaxID=35708 RepID=A0A0A9U3L5_ARUDO
MILVIKPISQPYIVSNILYFGKSIVDFVRRYKDKGSLYFSQVMHLRLIAEFGVISSVNFNLFSYLYCNDLIGC